MKKEKNPTLFRYEKIDECLVKRTRKWTSADLVEYVKRELEMENGPGAKIGKRQINYDLANMRRYHKSPIETKRQGKDTYVFYTDDNYSFKRPVYEKDLSLLTEVIDILGEIRGLNHAKEVAELRMRLQNQKNKIEYEGTQAIRFQSLPVGLGEEHVTPLLEAINNREVVKVVHQRYNCDEQRTWTLHPYCLIEHEKHWYLYCYVHGLKTMASSRLTG